MTPIGIEGTLARRLRLAGILLLAGLLIQVLTLARPTTSGSFLFFALLGIPLVLAGIGVYLVSIVTQR